MTTATFADRIAELRRMTHARDGSVTMRVIVDQVYAHYQHERMDLRHPRGGRAKYLEGPLFDHYRDFLHDYAGNVLRDGGIGSLMRSAERLSDLVEVEAPLDFGDLRRSGHPQVYAGLASDGRVLRDRAPKQHRLSKQELRIKNRLRKLPPALIGYIWWHVMHKQEPPPHLRFR